MQIAKVSLIPTTSNIVTAAFSSGNNPLPPTKAASVFKIDYQELFVTLSKKAAGDATTLLLYLLVHRNQAFKTYLLNRADLEHLVIEQKIIVCVV